MILTGSLKCYLISVPKKKLRSDVALGLMIVFICVTICPSPASAQMAPRDGHTPRGALLRSVAVPGWGQLYNRQYYKVPIVYAGLGLLAYLVVDRNSEYTLYRHAFLFKAWDEEVLNDDAEVNPFPQFESDYAKLLAREGLNNISSSSLEPIRDSLRRNRDLSILGIGVVYALSTLDAYVSAHLLQFDISEDLSLRVLPVAGGVGIELNLGR